MKRKPQGEVHSRISSKTQRIQPQSKSPTPKRKILAERSLSTSIGYQYRVCNSNGAISKQPQKIHKKLLVKQGSVIRRGEKRTARLTSVARPASSNPHHHANWLRLGQPWPFSHPICSPTRYLAVMMITPDKSWFQFHSAANFQNIVDLGDMEADWVRMTSLIWFQRW
jgi:hypothetical protein